MKWLKKVAAAILSFSGCSSQKKQHTSCNQVHCTCVGANVCHQVSHHVECKSK